MKPYKYHFTFIIFLCLVIPCRAQWLKTDSLLKILSPKQDITRVSQLLDLATAYFKKVPTDSANVKKYANEALTLAKKLHDDRGEIRAYSIMSESLFKYLDVKNCSTKINFALERCNTMSNVDDLKGSLLSLKGLVSISQGDFSTAHKYLDQAIRIIEMGMTQHKSSDYDFLTPLYNTNKRLGYIMILMANDNGQSAVYTAKGIAYYRKNVLLCQQNKALETGLSDAYHNLGATFGFLNVHIDSVHYYMDKEIAIATKLGQVIGQIQGYTVKAQRYFKDKQYKKAEQMMLKVKPLAENAHDFDVILNVPIMLGEIYTELGRYDEAKAMLERGYKIAIENNLRERKQRIVEGLYIMYELKGDYKKAYTYLYQYHSLKDSLYSEAKTKEISELNTKYETEKKEQQIKALETEKKLRNYLITALIALAIGSGFAVWSKYKAIILEKTLMQQTALLKQEQTEKLQIEMDSQQRALAMQGLYLEQRKNILQEVKTKLTNINNTDTLDKKAIVKEIDNTLHIEYEWQKARVHVENIDPEFFQKILLKHNNLTDLELRHLAYIKLGLSPKQVAQLLNIETESASMARVRLKKKLNLSTEVNLKEFVQGV
jgi:tetratricopeptide (TPR) repeat protein